MQYPFIDRKYLTRAIRDRLARLHNDKRPRDDKSADRETMSVTTLAGARGEVLSFYFGVTIGSKLRLKVVFIHRSLPFVCLNKTTGGSPDASSGPLAHFICGRGNNMD
jgi:hypothetical protein